MGLLPPIVEEAAGAVASVDPPASPLVDLGANAAEAVRNALGNFSNEAREAAAESYDQVETWLTQAGVTLEQYAQELEDLDADQLQKYLDFLRAVESLKILRAEIDSLHANFEGVTVKDLLSGGRKAHAIALAEKTANLVNLFQIVIAMLNDLIGASFFGESLKNRLRNRNFSIIDKMLSL